MKKTFWTANANYYLFVRWSLKTCSRYTKLLLFFAKKVASFLLESTILRETVLWGTENGDESPKIFCLNLKRGRTGRSVVKLARKPFFYSVHWKKSSLIRVLWPNRLFYQPFKIISPMDVERFIVWALSILNVFIKPLWWYLAKILPRWDLHAGNSEKRNWGRHPF